MDAALASLEAYQDASTLLTPDETNGEAGSILRYPEGGTGGAGTGRRLTDGLTTAVCI